MEVMIFMGVVAVLAPLITVIIALRKNYSFGEGLLWGLLTLIMAVSFGGVRGALPMLVCAIIAVYIATRMPPRDQLPNRDENNSRPNG